MRIALLDRPALRGWRGCGNRFASVAAVLAAVGHEVLLVGAPATQDSPASACGRFIDLAPAAHPVLAALDRATPAGCMIDAHLAAHSLAGLDPDLVIAPLRGGLAQGILMARACGEAFAATRVALWCDGTSRERMLSDETSRTDIASLIADALERQTLALADALLVTDDAARAQLAPLGSLPGLVLPAALPRDRPESLSRAGQIDEIVHVGPLARVHGSDAFVEAMERLAASGALGARLVSFLGPAQAQDAGLGPQWLGLRAQAWPFPFRLLERSWQGAIDYLAAERRLAVMVAAQPDELPLLDRCGARRIVLRNDASGATSLSARIERSVADAIADHAIEQPDDRPVGDWSRLVVQVSERSRAQASRAVGVTVCVLHRNRLSMLAQALASIPNDVDGAPVELLVVDNASTIDDVDGAIRDLAGQRTHLKILRLEQSRPFAGAYNAGLAAAGFETVIFLDDDNLLTGDGAARLAHAIGGGAFDVVVSPLDVFDHGSAVSDRTVLRTIFLGAAHSAGLFFNGFGDTAMAVRRDAFRRIGGFHDIGIPYPCADWVTLARAQAHGLRIGTLQWPAFRYRRDLARAERSAIKLDQDGARRFVLGAYGSGYDAELVARYAQSLDFSLA